MISLYIEKYKSYLQIFFHPVGKVHRSQQGKPLTCLLDFHVSNDFERRDLICQIKEIKNVLKLSKKTPLLIFEINQTSIPQVLHNLR